MAGRAPAPAASATTPTAPSPPVALYVHVPFCLSVCPYCDFVVHGGRSATRGPRGLIEPLVAALQTEIVLRGEGAERDFGARRPRLRSIFIGGGTPSLLSARELGLILSTADRAFGIARGAEITLEANPGSADRGDVAGFGTAGVNRLSIGAQSMVPGELRALGRRHAPADVRQTVSIARRAGMASISVDLMYDVPTQTPVSWTQTLDLVLGLEPDHVSAYALTLDDPQAEGLAGPMGDHLSLRDGARRWRRQARAAQDSDRAADLYLEADHRLAAAGLRWYEISNWARADHQSRHNLVYWQSGAYEAVGPGAHAFDGFLTRRWNAAPLAGYLAALLKSGEGPALPPGTGQVADHALAAAERAILALRLRRGVAADSASPPALAWGRSTGLLARSRGRLYLTRRGRLLANELFVRLLPNAEGSAASA